MLDLALYDRVRLSRRPPLQRLIADGWLRFDYRKVDLVVEGLENLPDRPVIFAMNHTDNFNYWPFQYDFHRRGAYTATWVKGKNYEHPGVSAFMRWTNNIPIASRGYVVTRDFLNTVGRRPSANEYRALRDAADSLGDVDRAAVPAAVLDSSRDMLGRSFDPTHERYSDAVDGLMRLLMRRFLDMNAHAHELGLHILVFPQGSRSIRLSKGHTGIAQMALHLDAPIVPVGCNGCDRVYTSRSMRAKPGRIVYRIGEPMSDWGHIAPSEPFEAFTREAERDHRASFQAITDRVMDRINDLLDERHKFAADQVSDGTDGTARFV